jgi:hypothetical protein
MSNRSIGSAAMSTVINAMPKARDVSSCRPLIADYKLPELFRIGSEPLARNQNGKFDKPALRALAAAARLPCLFTLRS